MLFMFTRFICLIFFFFSGWLFKGWNKMNRVKLSRYCPSTEVRLGKVWTTIFSTVLYHVQWPSWLHSLLLRRESFPVCGASQVVRLEKTSLPLFMPHCVLPCQLIFLSLYLFIPLKGLVAYGESVVANCILQYLSPKRHSSWRQRKTLQ